MSTTANCRWADRHWADCKILQPSRKDASLSTKLNPSPLQGSEIHAQLHHKLLAALTAAQKKAGGRVRAFQKQLEESRGADSVQMQGDMITANLYRCGEFAQ